MATYYVSSGITTGSGTGADWTNAYASLSVAEDALDGTMTEAITIECETNAAAGSPAEGTYVVFDGFSGNSATYTITVKATTGQTAQSSWQSSRWRMQATASYIPAITSNVKYITFEGLQIESTSSVSDGALKITPVSGTPATTAIYVLGCFCRNLTTYNAAGAGVWAKDCTITVRNTVSANCENGYRFSYGSGGCTVTCENCTAINASYDYGFYTDSDLNTSVAKNCYAGGSAGYDWYGTWDTLTTCYSADGSASTSTAACSTSSGAYFTNVTDGSEDIEIGASSGLKDVGTDLSAGGWSNDIEGHTRSGSWDVGAYEYTASGPTMPVFEHYYRRLRGL